MFTRKLLPAFILFVTLFNTGCANKSTEAGIPRKVSSSEAQQVSQILTKNAELKNAAFKIVQLGDSNQSDSATGIIDWQNERVLLNVVKKDSTELEISTLQTKSVVYETFPAVSEMETLQGLTPRKWIQRPVNKTYGTDIIGIYLLGLTAEAPENPVLLQQGDIRYLGTKMVNGETTKIFRQSDEYTYFINGENILTRIDAQLPGFTTNLAFVFYDHSNQKIELPLDSEYYPSSEITSSYTDIRPKL